MGIYASEHILDELERVLAEELGFSRRLALLSKRRIVSRANLVEPGAARHNVPEDAADTPFSARHWLLAWTTW
jgi:hypothetical protein